MSSRKIVKIKVRRKNMINTFLNASKST